jgi:primase-polymerase (primpol)-like protein
MTAQQRLLVPAELIELRQFVYWRYETRDAKLTKVPYTAMGYRADTTDPETWSRYDYLVEFLHKHPAFAAGVGFVFTGGDPYCGIDLDDVWKSDADEGAKWAQGILERFDDTYGEGSPSDRGYKIWCRAKAPKCKRWTVGSGAIEVYDHSRFFTITGRSNRVMVIADHESDIEALVANLEGGEQRSRERKLVSIDAKIPKGTRHPMLVSLAGTMFRRGMVPEAIEAALLVVNEKQCDPPYDQKHIKQIVQWKGWDR